MRRMGGSIFERGRLTANQLRTVADRRFDDARYLKDSGENKHANGAMYLAGFVVECLLKAKLLEKHRWLASSPRPDPGWSLDKRYVWELCYRSHDLDEILAQLPAITRELDVLEQAARARLRGQLKAVCAEWTIYARYSPRQATIPEAERFIGKIKEIRPWLR